MKNVIENAAPVTSEIVKPSIAKSLFSAIKNAPLKTAAIVLGTGVVVSGVVYVVKKVRANSKDSVVEGDLSEVVEEVVSETAEDVTGK